MQLETVETIIIGGGQAGLALSYDLRTAGHEHVVLERGRTVERWRSERWDSLTLLSPNWMTRLPGQHYTSPDPDGFMSRDEVVSFFERYAASFQAPVYEGVNVLSVDRETHRGYVVHTDRGSWRTQNVVIATGMFQHPKLPAWSVHGTGHPFQIHSSHYRNPELLPPGGVLVVGSGASGFQIAEELNRYDRPVYFSVGRHERPPRRYRGHDVMWWLQQMGVFDQVVANPTDRWQHSASVPPAVVPPSPALTGVRGGHDMNPHHLAADGVVLLGRLQGIEDGVLGVAPDLLDSLKQGDGTYLAWRQRIDDYIRDNGISAPLEPPPLDYPISASEQSPIQRLDLRAGGISTIVWASGFSADFSWVHAPVFDADHRPMHYRGVTSTEGLYFLRIAPFYKRKATLIDGVEEDAGYLADRLTSKAAPVAA
jgi:putative flavoprotein involved in K+ transport